MVPRRPLVVVMTLEQGQKQVLPHPSGGHPEQGPAEGVRGSLAMLKAVLGIWQRGPLTVSQLAGPGE